MYVPKSKHNGLFSHQTRGWSYTHTPISWGLCAHWKESLGMVGCMIKRCCLAGILNIFMMSYQPESVGNCGDSPAKMRKKNTEMMMIGWGMKSKFDGGIFWWLGWLKSRTQHVGIHKRFDQHKTMEFYGIFKQLGVSILRSLTFVSLLTVLFLHPFATLRTRGFHGLHVPSSKVWGRGPLWNQPKVAGDDADVVQQMVATSVPKKVVDFQTTNMTMIDPDPNARNGKHGKPSILKCPYLMGTYMGTTKYI